MEPGGFWTALKKGEFKEAWRELIDTTTQYKEVLF